MGLNEEGFKEALLKAAEISSNSTIDVLKTHPKYGKIEEIRAPDIAHHVYTSAKNNDIEELRSLLREWSSLPNTKLMADLRQRLSRTMGEAMAPAVGHGNRDMIHLLLKHGVRPNSYGYMLNQIKDDMNTYEPILQDMIDAGVNLPQVRGVVAYVFHNRQRRIKSS